MGLKDVQKRYRLPELKRGMRVTRGGEDFVIIGTPRGSSSYINVCDGDGYRYTFHPFDVDYWTDNRAILARGKDLKEKYNGAGGNRK